VKAIMPESRVIVLAGRSASNDILPFLLAGACGYLIKPVLVSELLSAVGSAISGRLALSAEAERLMLQSLHCAGIRSHSMQLTPREEQILALVIRIQRDKAIAEALGIGLGTVHVHLANIFKKLGVHNRDQAVAKVFGLGAA
jgi:DNA-binding NarL/FixJ family response regulator